MNAMTGFPHQLHWGPLDLADAVPLKLSELYGFDAHGRVQAPANSGEARGLRSRRRGYLPTQAPLHGPFRVD